MKKSHQLLLKTLLLRIPPPASSSLHYSAVMCLTPLTSSGQTPLNARYAIYNAIDEPVASYSILLLLFSVVFVMQVCKSPKQSTVCSTKILQRRW